MRAKSVYVLNTGQNVLLSLPDITKIGLIIDTQRHLCHIRDPVDICSNGATYRGKLKPLPFMYCSAIVQY